MDVLQRASVLGDGHVAVALLALGIGVALIGWGVPQVRARWREALGFGPVLPSPRPLEDFELLATTIIGKAYDHGRARYREVLVERTTGGVVISLAGQVVGPMPARKARDLIVEHLRGAA